MISKPIQIIPPGLLGFLQLKNSGKSPTDFPDTLQPTMELFEWYMQARAENWSQSRGGGAASSTTLATGVTGAQVFTTNPMIVPNDEYWWVDRYSINSGPMIATDTAAIACCLSDPITGIVNNYIMDDVPAPLTGNAAGNRRVQASCGGFFASPGSQFTIFAGVNETASTIAYSAFLRFTPLPV